MKTQEQINNQLESYLTKTSQHLFWRKADNKMQKFIFFKRDGKMYYAHLTIQENFEVRCFIKNVEKLLEYQSLQNKLSGLKRYLFPLYMKGSPMVYTSIPYFRKMYDFISEVEFMLDSTSLEMNRENMDKLNERVKEIYSEMFMQKAA